MAAISASLGLVARRAAVWVARRGVPALQALSRSHTGQFVKSKIAQATKGPGPRRWQLARASDKIYNMRYTPSIAKRGLRRQREIKRNAVQRFNTRLQEETDILAARGTRATDNLSGFLSSRQNTRGVQALDVGIGKAKQAGATRTGRFTRSAVKTGAVDIGAFKAVEQLEQWTQQLERRLEQEQLSEQEKNIWIDRLESGVETLNEDMEMIRRVVSVVAIRSLITRSTRLIRRLSGSTSKVPKITSATAETAGKRIGEQAKKYQQLYRQHRPEFYGSMAGTLGAVAYEQEDPLQAVGALRGGGGTRLVTGFGQAVAPSVAKAAKTAGVGSVRSIRNVRGR